ncbi:MAG: 3',5'-cyclic-AMP phosphodiesterase [Lamprobacter sp.]|uniref:3',5'-cyclic-AMP phosphodiesterase n=1 Tax=Lamprobacter sp. TaxID=3100796 RepID=UPI002B263C6F|nr:3',5'-cyclic-AMP phosphodiesterase [Lamprobacter sp.]MEA3640389.1 3',5'-cyclic-AMP phosphodiesterase [Lamprobacter sp.]
MPHTSPPFQVDNRVATKPSNNTSQAKAQPGQVTAQRVLQFTDLHLYAEPDRQLYDYCTRNSFEQVLSLAQRTHWPPDAILFTGDLVHDERAEGYRYLRQCIERLGCPCFCIPGNHDRPDLLAAEVEPGADRDFRVERLGPWDLLLLDSTLSGSEAGHLQPQTLAALEHHLQSSQQRPALVALHHQPIPVDSRWLDSMQIENGADLITLAERYSQLRLILWGHVHQAFDRQLQGTRLLAAPSTCTQFKPGSDDFARDSLAPGYRWLQLEPDGSLQTGIERLDASVTSS